MEITTDLPFSSVTRIEIRTELGSYRFWADQWTAEIHDDGRTLTLVGRSAS